LQAIIQVDSKRVNAIIVVIMLNALYDNFILTLAINCFNFALSSSPTDAAYILHNYGSLRIVVAA